MDNRNILTETRLRDALGSITAECKELKRSSEISSAKTKKQMENALISLNLSSHQLKLLNSTCSDLLDTIKKQEQKLSLVLQFKAKMVNVSKDLNISINQAYQILADCERNKEVKREVK